MKTALELAVDLMVARVSRVPMQPNEITRDLNILYDHLSQMMKAEAEAQASESKTEG